MKKILIVVIILICIALIIKQAKGASWKQVIGYGLSGSTGVALKVDSEGKVYLH